METLVERLIRIMGDRRKNVPYSEIYPAWLIRMGMLDTLSILYPTSSYVNNERKVRMVISAMNHNPKGLIQMIKETRKL